MNRLQEFTDAFVLHLSGAGKYNKYGELEWMIDTMKQKVYLSFPTSSPRKVIISKYYKNGNKRWELNYEDGLAHGKLINYCKRVKIIETYYEHGLATKQVQYNKLGNITNTYNFVD